MRRILSLVTLGIVLSFGTVAVLTVAATPAAAAKHKAKPKPKPKHKAKKKPHTVNVSQEYLTVYNTMVTADNAAIPQENSTDSATSTAGIDARISARQTFDTAVAAIPFTGRAASDAQAVLNDDAALEQVLGTLAANTDDVSNYNAIFATVTSAQATFSSATAALNRDLGLTG